VRGRRGREGQRSISLEASERKMSLCSRGVTQTNWLPSACLPSQIDHSRGRQRRKDKRRTGHQEALQARLIGDDRVGQDEPGHGDLAFVGRRVRVGAFWRAGGEDDFGEVGGDGDRGGVADHFVRLG
jgi:hypothetical protein